jgi:hypothetical protein
MSLRIKIAFLLFVWSAVCLWVGFMIGSQRSLSKLPFYHPGDVVSYSSNAVTYLGWSGTEQNFRWSASESPEILFKPNLEYHQSRLSEILINLKYTMGTQRVVLYLNDSRIGETEVAGESQIRFEFDSSLLIDKSKNSFRFELPGLRSPGERDPRRLSIALKDFVIREAEVAPQGG